MDKTKPEMRGRNRRHKCVCLGVLKSLAEGSNEEGYGEQRVWWDLQEENGYRTPDQQRATKNIRNLNNKTYLERKTKEWRLELTYPDPQDLCQHIQSSSQE